MAVSPSEASLNNPSDVALDQSGNLYIADAGNHRIRKVTPEGIITTMVGRGTLGFGRIRPRPTALLNTPKKLAIDTAGNLFFYDSGNFRIRRIGIDGTINTVAGNGNSGYSGKVQPCRWPRMSTDRSPSIPKATSILATSKGPYVWQVTPQGRTSIMAGNGSAGFSGDNGPALKASLRQPYGIAVDVLDNLYIADFNSDRIRKITADGNIGTIAGTGVFGSTGDGGPALKATMNPIAVAVDRTGNVAIVDSNSSGIRRIDGNGVINTVLGNNGYRTLPDGTAAVNAFLFFPQGVATDGKGGLIVADTSAQVLRRLTADGTITTLAGTGTGGCCFDGGLATVALLDGPRSPVIDSAGDKFYFADAGNHRVRKVGIDGKISTVVGAGSFATGGAYDGDGAAATKAHLNFPEGITFDRNGVLFISTPTITTIRKVAADGTISTYAGTGGQPGFSGDGGQATSAKLNYPKNIIFDASNNLYIADAYNHSIRKVNARRADHDFRRQSALRFLG